MYVFTWTEHLQPLWHFSPQNSFEARVKKEKNGHSSLNSLLFFPSSDNSSTHILLAGFTYYGIACIHTALSVSSVAGRDFFFFFLNGWYMCHGSMGFYSAFRHRKGFLYEWPLTKAVIYFWFVERVTFHFTDIFSLISETSRL